MLRKLRPGPESFVPEDREESKAEADGVDHEEEEKTGEDTEEKENMIRKTLPSIGNRWDFKTNNLSLNKNQEKRNISKEEKET